MEKEKKLNPSFDQNQKKMEAEESTSNHFVQKEESLKNSKPSKKRPLKNPKKLKLSKKHFSSPKSKNISSSQEKDSAESEVKLKNEIDELKKSYLYLQSEFANFKRISEKQRVEFVEYSNVNFIQDLLTNVFNDFNTALEQPFSNENFNVFKKGIEIIHQKFLKYLEQKGVQEISPQKGDIFDPHIHEVLNTQFDKSIPENTILHVCKKGYKVKERLIQPAQVIVNQQS